ncbi:hypothetical protein LP419_38835 [Massilia sp. H-1]|nr:hypothetical protein LP419_38835 [Massilia sp. H-1]
MSKPTGPAPTIARRPPGGSAQRARAPSAVGKTSAASKRRASTEAKQGVQHGVGPGYAHILGQRAVKPGLDAGKAEQHPLPALGVAVGMAQWTQRPQAAKSQLRTRWPGAKRVTPKHPPIRPRR